MFEQALERAPDLRAAFLDEACPEEGYVRREVEELLAAHDRLGDFLAEPLAPEGALVPTLLDSVPSATTGRLDMGRVVDGKYRLDGLLGAGGMGAVYRAWHLQLERAVALKVIRGARREDPTTAERFRREAVAIARLRHPHIVTVHDYGVSEDVGAYIVMELLEGRSLREELAARGPLDVGEAIGLIGQACKAVEAAHRAGIVHRDIKPENIFLEQCRSSPREGAPREGAPFVKVLDFGLARLEAELSGDGGMALEAAAGALPAGGPTPTGGLFGTPLYMSPEQVRGGRVDARTDVWSLAVTLYELLAGSTPFKRSQVMRTLDAIVHDEPPPLAHVPHALARLLERALAKEADDRLASAGDLAAELERIGSAVAAETAETLRVESRPAESRPAAAGPAAAGPAAARPDAQQPAGAATAGAGADTSAAVGASTASLHEEDGPLIGREVELRKLTDELRRGPARLVTLTGPGGTGKTRLARRAAFEVAREFEHGAAFVDLSAIRDPELVAPTIAAELGVREAGDAPLERLLERHLAGRTMLLVLDNFEHVLEAAPLVARLLAAAPGVKALATSRAQLRVGGERAVAVPPLALPPDGATPEELARCGSVALFVERARAARRSFALSERNAAAVAELCRRLEGLPLAIELAAARLNMLSPDALLARLGARLRLLTAGHRDLPERQRTMRAAVAWSYDLLEEKEARVFERLAVFAGGCRLEQAERVCAGGPVAAGDVLDALSSLVEHSLVAPSEDPDGEMRFRMLEVVREYAAERLAARGDANAAARAHAESFAALGEEALPGLRSSEQPAWVARLEADLDNLRAALAWLLERDPDTAVRLAGAIRDFWTSRGHYDEGRRLTEAALERGRGAAPAARARALKAAAVFAQLQGELERSRGYAAEVVRVAREDGSKFWEVSGLQWLGVIALEEGDRRAAYAYQEEALAGARELGDKSSIIHSLNALGEIARLDGDLGAARRFYEQAIEVDGRTGSRLDACIMYANLGAVACEAGDLAAAEGCYREALEIGRQLGSGECLQYAMDGFGAVAARRGEWERAARLSGVAARLRAEIGFEQDLTDREFRERYVARAREALGADGFEAAEAAGRALALEDAVSLAGGSGAGTANPERSRAR